MIYLHQICFNLPDMNPFGHSLALTFLTPLFHHFMPFIAMLVALLNLALVEA